MERICFDEKHPKSYYFHANEHQAPSTKHQAPSTKHRSFVALLIVFFVIPVHPQAQDTYPIPVSESVEKTGPGTMLFLSYPKYYRDTEEKLALVETDLVESTDPEWDYEVSKGIWQLKVKTDGTFQAQHEGDVFTYRFQSLGYGLGDSFQPIDLGEPNFSNLSVKRNVVVWADVFPDVNLRIIYANDTLKVDVIINQAFRNDLQDVYQAGDINENEFLTAKFDIPSVFVGSEARQGEEPVDLYSQNLDINTNPIYFVRNEKVVHKLRLVETYVIDEDGQPIYADENGEPINIQSKQNWQLSRGGPGIAEISTNIKDIINAPQGDIMIDPSLSFGYNTGATQDAELDYNNSSNLGGNSVMTLEYNSSPGIYDRAVIGCDFNDPSYNPLGTNKAVTDVKLKIRIRNNTLSGSPDFRIYNITEEWTETSADWYEHESGNPWINAGGTYNNYYKGQEFSTTSSNTDVEIDLLVPFLVRYPYFPQYLSKGILLKLEGGSGGYVELLSKEYVDPSDGSTDERWSFEVTYVNNARAQTVRHNPILKKQDGDILEEVDRWFPIGSYYNIHARTSSSKPASHHLSVQELSQEQDYGEFYNCIMGLGNVDPQNKQDPIQSSTDDLVYVQSYVNMLTTLGNISSSTIDYNLIPVVTHLLTWPDKVNSYPWDIFSMATYYPTAHSWTNEEDEVESVVNTIKNHSRVYGWHLGDEPYGGKTAENLESSYSGFREHIRNRLDDFKQVVEAEDHHNKSIHLDLRGYGNYWDGETNDIPTVVSNNWLDDLDVQDYIWDSSMYYNDALRNGDDWHYGVVQAEAAFLNAVDNGYADGYIRFVQSHDFGDPDANGNQGTSPSNPIYSINKNGLQPDGLYYHEIDLEKHRYLAYSSWVAGGQGLIFFRIDRLKNSPWLEDNSHSTDLGITNRLALEAHTMQEWLMNEPANDINAYIYDNHDSSRVRFILKRHPDSGEDRFLVLFCNFSNDQNNHTTYIHFPNKTINDLDEVQPYLTGDFSVEGSGHTIKFVPNNMDSKDVYARACFVEFN